MSELDYVAPDVRNPGPSVKQSAEVATPTPVAAKPEESSLARTLEALNERVTAESRNTQLLSDPNIRAYVEARQRGEQVKIVPDKPAEPAPAGPPEPADLESMTNADMVKYLVAKLETAVKSTTNSVVEQRLEALKKELSPTLQQLSADTQYRHSQDAQRMIEQVKSAHSDFEQMRPAMLEVNKTVQGLTVEELYQLAKLRSGVPAITQKSIETERPGSASGRSKYKVPDNINGRQGFEAVLDAALSRDNLPYNTER